MNITDDYDMTPTVITIPTTDIAASSDPITITIPPYTGATTWPLDREATAPNPRQRTSAKSKAQKKARRKQATLAKRRNR
ncbi:hypothetical protein N9917_00555 [Deltaproteobacteria bacterium]|nr:hypothetical protein [Deltaproteobacteria bacterium]